MSSERCPPVKLPIHIETSCGGNYCKSNDCSTSNGCSVDSTLSFQGTFQNNCCKNVQQVSEIVIAYLSNDRNSDCSPDAQVTLNPICLDWCDFILLFYRINNSFSILPNAANTCPISFFGRTYESTTSTDLNFSLGTLVRSAWAEKCETTADNIPPKLNIKLNRDICNINSLSDATSAITLSLDQAIETLIANGEIAPADSTQSAKVKFIIQYKYVYRPLNVSVLVNFVYYTKIPCYKNLNFCDNWCPPYSRDPCVACEDSKTGSPDDILKYLSKNNFETDSTTGFSDSTSQHEEDSISDDLKDFSKADDKTFISVDSSKW
jgi:hypothetical protein